MIARQSWILACINSGESFWLEGGETKGVLQSGVKGVRASTDLYLAVAFRAQYQG